MAAANGRATIFFSYFLCFVLSTSCQDPPGLLVGGSQDGNEYLATWPLGPAGINCAARRSPPAPQRVREKTRKVVLFACY
jgi:hypothetical protein